MFADIDYKEYITEPSPSVTQSVKDVVDDLIWRYTSVLMAQPFEVAKAILQVRSHDDLAVVAAPDSDTGGPEKTLSYESAMHNPVRTHTKSTEVSQEITNFTLVRRR